MQDLRTHHSLFPEVDADCGDELGVELVVCVSVQEGGLPHAGVPQGKELYKVVIIPISHSDDRNKPVENRQRRILTHVREPWTDSIDILSVRIIAGDMNKIVEKMK